MNKIETYTHSHLLNFIQDIIENKVGHKNVARIGHDNIVNDDIFNLIDEMVILINKQADKINEIE